MDAVYLLDPLRPEAARPPPRLPDLRQTLVLAVLLHLWLVALFGTVTGTALPGQGVSGLLNIRLAGSGPAAEEAPRPTPPAAYTGPTGSADDRRWGGQVRERDTALPPQDAPGAAREGTWNRQPTERAVDPLPPDERRAPEPPPPLRNLAAPAEVPALKPADALAPAPPPLASPLPPPEPLPEPAPTPPLVRSLSPPAAPTAAPQSRPLERVAPVEAPQLPPAPAPAPALLPQPAPPPPVRTLAPPPTPAPLPAQPPLERVTPAEALPSAAPPLRDLAPAPVRAPAATPGASAGPPAPATAPPGRDAEPAARPSFGAPDAGAQVGHDVATPPATAASAPRLNLELPRPRGGELSRQASPGVLNLLPPPPERKSKLAEDIEKAGKADCRNAYAGLGVLAVVPLAADAVRKDGCRW